MKYGKSSSKLFLYMLSSKPIVASNMPIAQVVMDEHCGILVDPTNPQEIANAIVYLLKNPVEATSMGKRGKEAVLTKYNWDISAQKLLSVYEHVIPNAEEKPSTSFGILH
jgi:glycosyltransferase involved in cell wall biosynthesis